MPHHARGSLADRFVPFDRQGLQVDRDQPVAVLQTDEHGRGIRRVVQMAGGRDDLEAFHQLQGLALIDIDLVARQGGGGEMVAIRAEPELIGVRHRHALLNGAGCRVQEQHLVAGGVADQQAFPIRTEHQMMRLPQHRDAPNFLQGTLIHDADRRGPGIEDKGHARSIRGSAKDVAQKDENKG